MALIGAGMARYGHRNQAARLFEGLLEEDRPSSTCGGLPELFYGLPGSAAIVPRSYPVACSPQAWASGAMIASCNPA